jgi:uncharacterized protein (DUF488 family)
MFFTIGHSNRTWEEFVRLLKHHKINVLVDVRHFPTSKTFPHFNKDAIMKNLINENILYIHMQRLGGRRKPGGNDLNSGWKNRGFQGYADYMQTQHFKDAINALMNLEGNIAIMCAEAVPWKCHRRLISDYLTINNIQVFDIIGMSEPKQHELTAFARIIDNNLIYPSNQRKLLDDNSNTK